ncbi:hypothetical protein Dalk_0038 [Desulfatibacillum aliphaticivorans]|uniref:Uncharacterized protein n=1 Tax=Desulfatibacillum aliphaticivorans TaxID=218208 RepID=B8FKD3_DESAL|nr:hypothetical protein Dalk_0038 [Desulfatibacillum aliphaticivorans]
MELDIKSSDIYLKRVMNLGGCIYLKYTSKTRMHCFLNEKNTHILTEAKPLSPEE